MTNKKGQNSKRIPVRFLDEEGVAAMNDHHDEDEHQDQDDAEESSGEKLSAEEIGRASSYEDETEVQRRIDRGGEDDRGDGQSSADDKDVAGGPAHSDLPEQREDQASRASSSSARPKSEAGGEAPGAAGPLMAELLATRAELKRIETARRDLLDQLARRQADFENYRKRIERDRSESYARTVAEIVKQLLPVIDNLRRALDTESSFKSSESEEFRHFLQGVELIYKQLNDVLENLGVRPVAAVGEPFDPHIHEAIITEQTEEYEPDTVMQEIVRGYRLGERLLRPAMVKVATR